MCRSNSCLLKVRSDFVRGEFVRVCFSRLVMCLCHHRDRRGRWVTGTFSRVVSCSEILEYLGSDYILEWNGRHHSRHRPLQTRDHPSESTTPFEKDVVILSIGQPVYCSVPRYPTSIYNVARLFSNAEFSIISIFRVPFTAVFRNLDT
jgi:hypothetical protein